ncbi:restriction endonuclease [Pedosphaera parvula]|uniref:Restriction endonuclease n=1 Tax=Pedosphaera parvula (strain Ellin514) TaxID=320771 RepID=B9XT21_PEDPL|nr:restriction endonuclease [Pedosphaera parvula]EEF57011.1 restriction endonuclease [Pedosphaera parvula Ellin514]
MSRRRRNDPLDALPQLAGLVILAVFFIPGASRLLIWGAAIFFILLVAFIIFRIATRKNRSQTTTTRAPKTTLHSHAPTPSHTAPAPTLSEKLHHIDWYQFEKLLGILYRSKGYFIHRLGGAQPDGGVDLIIEREGIKTIIQCKHWESWTVGVRNIREFLGTLTDQQISQGIYVTLKGYTNGALQLAKKHNITLLGEPELMALCENLNWKQNPEILSLLNDTRKLCPKCESEMVLRTSGRGPNRGNQFWGCSTYPKCHYILNIS